MCVCARERESERVGRKAVLRMHLSIVSEVRIMVRSWAQSNIKETFSLCSLNKINGTRFFRCTVGAVLVQSCNGKPTT